MPHFAFPEFGVMASEQDCSLLVSLRPVVLEEARDSDKECVRDEDGEAWKVADLEIRGDYVIRVDDEWMPTQEEMKWVVDLGMHELPVPFCDSDKVAQAMQSVLEDLTQEEMRELLWNMMGFED